MTVLPRYHIALVHRGGNRSMISAPGVRPTWLVLIMGSIQPQWTRVSLWCHAERSPVTLSEAKGVSRVAHEMLRCAQHDRTALSVTMLSCCRCFPGCHPEYSEGSVSCGVRDAERSEA